MQTLAQTGTELMEALAERSRRTNSDSTTDNEALQHLSKTHEISPLRSLELRPMQPVAVVALIPALRLRPETFAAAMAKIGANYGVDYTAKDAQGNPTENRAKALALWETLKSDGWTESDFTAQVHGFLKRQSFDRWTIADFVNGTTPPVLHSHVWAAQEQKKDPTAKERMEAYQVGEKTLWRYIPENENAIEGLQRVFFRGAWQNTELLPKTQPSENGAAKTDTLQPSEETNFASMWAKSEKRVSELEERLQKMAQENDRLRRKNDELQSQLLAESEAA